MGKGRCKIDFDDRLAESLHRKRNRPRGALSFVDVAAFKTLSFCFGSKTWRYDQPHDWSELERYIEHDCREIRAADFRPDAIIGIRSGGGEIRTYRMFTQGYRPDFGRRAGIMINCPWDDDP